MSNKEELYKIITIGNQAKKLLSDELLSGLFYSRKNQACESFVNTNESDDKKRRQLWQQVQGVIAIEQELQGLIESGKIASEELDSLENLNESGESPHNFIKE